MIVVGQKKNNKAERIFRTGYCFFCYEWGCENSKSVLFPSVVKALSNNREVVKLMYKYGHGVSYDLVEEIETEYALDVINKQREKGASF